MTVILATFLRMTTTAVPYVDTERFVALVEQSPGMTLVDFTADWCPPCRRLAPDIDALAGEFADSLTVVKVNVDDQPELASRFSVLSVPTVMFFRDGQIVDRTVGAPPLAQLRAKVDEFRRQRRQ
jgi:thioredoxin 1